MGTSLQGMDDMEHVSARLSTRGFSSQHLRKAWRDFFVAWTQFSVWQALAYHDIKLRYRRSVLGPLWVTISMGVTIGAMGVIYAQLFHMAIAQYLPFLTAGMIAWVLISGLINDLSDALIANEALIKQIKLPFYLYLHRVIWRNGIVLVHNLVIFALVLMVFPRGFSHWSALTFIIPNLMLVYLNALGLGMILALASARYRDFPMIIKNMLQVLFFVTPIMWQPAGLSKAVQLICYLNPLYSFVELIRQPLLGQSTPLHVYVSAWGITFFCLFLGGALFARFRHRIVYWL